MGMNSASCGRNYFTRASAPKHIMEEERELVLAESAELKKVADWYLHPEKKIVVDPTAFGRNFFTRPSVQEEEGVDMEEERKLVLAEAAELKKVAGWYLHPEKKVAVDSTASGRNFFTRSSAQEDDCMDDERECILAEAAELKKMSNWCNNPSQPVVSNGFATARNFFTRLSAPEEEDDDMDDKRESILVKLQSSKRWLIGI